MNKTAGLGMTIKIGIGLVLGIIILLFALSIGTNFLGIFFTEPSEQTEKSMENLIKVIEKLGDKESDSFLFTTSNDFYLVAFNKGKLGKSGIKGYYEKPANECYDMACLVMCSDSEDVNACMDSKVVRSIEEIEVIDVKTPGNQDAGIVTYTQGKMINLYVAKNNNRLILKELEEGESVDDFDIYIE